jgi:hypothetical protein
MTDFEKAQIKLRAWEALVGWGTTKDNKLSEPWDWNDRLKYADLLATWAIGDAVSTPTIGGENG